MRSLLPAVAQVSVALTLGLAACNGNDPTATKSDAPKAVADPNAKPATADVTALLDGLKEGDSLGPGKVQSVLAVFNGVIEVKVEVDGKKVTLQVGLRSKDSPTPPTETERYAIYTAHENGPMPPDVDQKKVAEALGDRIKKVETAVPTPKGLGPVRKESRL